MRIRALTHSGTFHADEVTAFAVLRLIEPDLAPPEFVRTRDPDTVDRAEVVFDVGGTYDPGRRRYDHHMPDPPRREHKDGPYSSAGLIWRDYGRRAIRALAGDLDEETAAKLWERLDHAFFLPIDQVDNGQGHADALGFASLVDELNPLWNEDQAEEDARFLRAADLA